MKKGFSEQKVRPAGGRRSPKSFEYKSAAAEKIIRLLQGHKPKEKSNKKFLAFAKLSYEDKIKFLKRKLYRLYEQKLEAHENGLPIETIDNNIESLEKQIESIQIEMWE
jgi:hypothetical protein